MLMWLQIAGLANFPFISSEHSGHMARLRTKAGETLDDMDAVIHDMLLLYDLPPFSFTLN